MWLLALSLLLRSCSGHMMYQESTDELVCQDFVPSCSGAEYHRASRPHSSFHDPAVCRETTAAWSSALAWNHTYPFKQISVYGSLGQIHRMVFEWLGDLRTFIGCQNPLEALFCRIREAICLLWAVTAHFWISTVDFWSYCFLVEFGQDLPTFHLDSWLGQASTCHPRCSSGSSYFFPFQGQFSVSFTHQNPRQDPLICVFSVTPNPASSLCGECDLQLLQNDFFGLCWLQGALPTFISCLLPVLLGLWGRRERFNSLLPCLPSHPHHRSKLLSLFQTLIPR